MNQPWWSWVAVALAVAWALIIWPVALVRPDLRKRAGGWAGVAVLSLPAVGFAAGWLLARRAAIPELPADQEQPPTPMPAPPKGLEEETIPDEDDIPVYPLPPRVDADDPPAGDLDDDWVADFIAGAGEDGVLPVDEEEM